MASIDCTVRRRILEESRKAEEARVASVRAKVGDEITLQARVRDKQSRLVHSQNSDEQERRNLIDERHNNITDYLGNVAGIQENRFRQACAKWISMETQWALKQSEGEKLCNI